MDELGDLKKTLDEFIERYEEDMRGDNKINGGNIGLINTIRKIKDTQEKYPSVTWLFAHRPFSTIATGVGVFVLLSALYTVGLLKLVGALLGISLP